MSVDLYNPHTLSAAYALDALDEDERLAYEKHLDQCADCAVEVAGFLATCARLGDSAVETIPSHLRPLVMDAIARTPQQGPPGSTPERPVSRWRRVATRVTFAAAALAVIVGIGWSVNEHNRNEDLQARQSGITQVLAAPDAQMDTQRLDDGGSVGLVRSEDLDRGVLVTQNLPRLDDKHVYQMWTLTGDKPAPAGLLSDQSPDAPRSRLMSDLNGIDAVALTIEPAGGSKHPTTKPIAVLPAT